MRWLTLLVLLVLVSCRSANGPAEAPPVVIAGLVTREARTLRPDGVTVTTSYQERFIRSGDRVWIERVLPGGAHRTEPGATRHHEHDWSSAPRVIEHLADGGVSLTLVLRDTRELVSVVPPEWSSVGFDQTWDEVSQLVPLKLRSTLAASTRSDAPPGARWLERSTAADFVRVAWSESLGLALRIEAGSVDQRDWRSVAVERQPAPAVLPWDSVPDFSLRDINDYRD